jgi:hypothetical protein
MTRTITGKTEPIEGRVVTTDEQRARQLTDKIQLGLADVIALRGLIAEAFTTRAWAALGYRSWDAYTDAEFRSMVSLSREDQRALNVVLQLEEGMSARAAAAATGNSPTTAKQDADRQLSINGQLDDQPPGEPSPVVSPEPSAKPSDRRKGADGKSRPAARTRPEKAAQPAWDMGTTGERRVRDLATSKGLHLYRGDGFGCAPEKRDGKRYQAYTLLDYDSLHRGEDPDLMDSYILLCRITLDEAERYLTDGTIPNGHELHEESPYSDPPAEEEDPQEATEPVAEESLSPSEILDEAYAGLEDAIIQLRSEMHRVGPAHWWAGAEESRAKVLADATRTVQHLTEKLTAIRKEQHPWKPAIDRLAHQFGWDDEVAWSQAEFAVRGLKNQKPYDPGFVYEHTAARHLKASKKAGDPG